MKNTFVLILMLLFMGFLHNSCNKCNSWGDCEPAYTFKVTDSLIRKTDTVSLGDTIWLGTSFSDSLILDYHPYNKVHFPNAKLFVGLYIYNLEKDTPYEPDYALASGSYRASGIILDQKNDLYYQKVGLIFNKSGTYILSLETGWAISPTNCDCDNGKIEPELYVNKDRNSHLIPSTFVSNASDAFVVK